MYSIYTFNSKKQELPKGKKDHFLVELSKFEIQQFPPTSLYIPFVPQAAEQSPS